MRSNSWDLQSVGASRLQHLHTKYFKQNDSQATFKQIHNGCSCANTMVMVKLVVNQLAAFKGPAWPTNSSLGLLPCLFPCYNKVEHKGKQKQYAPSLTPINYQRVPLSKHCFYDTYTILHGLYQMTGPEYYILRNSP